MAYQKSVYNEYDHNQVRHILKKKKRKKLKRKFKVVLFLLAFLGVAWYFYSDYSKVSVIEVSGNKTIDSEDIKKACGVLVGDYHLFVSTNKIEEALLDYPGLKKVSVTKDLHGRIDINVLEADFVAYAIVGNDTYRIDENGDVILTKDADTIALLMTLPCVKGFSDLELLNEFAKEFVLIPDIVESQTTDITYAPLQADTTRVEFLLVNGKKFYLRIEDMVDQLNRFDYEANMTTYSDKCVFSFEGDNVYLYPCGSSQSSSSTQESDEILSQDDNQVDEDNQNVE